MLTALLVIVLQSMTYRLTVIGGSGSGVYPCAATVQIVGNKTRGAEVFAEWTTVPMGRGSFERVHHRTATIRNHDCQDLIVEARFTAKAPKGKR